jgi:hypothetical protein
MIDLLLCLAIAILGARSITRFLLYRSDGLTNGTILTLSTLPPTGLIFTLLVVTSGQLQIGQVIRAINGMIPWGFAIVAVCFLVSAIVSVRMCNQHTVIQNQQDRQDQLDVFE